jgi:predicted ATPase/DNA-binding CsgD family transcriptional regulator
MSQREAEVLGAVGRHLTNAQIASRLHISVRTVESHVSSLLRKFGVPDRRALAELAPAIAARPPAAAGEGPVVGLPAARTTFVGREREHASVLEALSDSRVVTLVGPGGVGKTRLAMRVATDAAAPYSSGGAFVDLVPVHEDSLTQAIATLLGVSARHGLSLDAALHEHLARSRSLLILDNCEHLLGVVSAFVEKLLADCTGLTVLATSRERLAVPGERTVSVMPLSLVADGENGAVYAQDSFSEACTLFIDRARASDPEFSAPADIVNRVCAQLDGVPLAIELAAARSASLGVDGLLAGLDDRLRLLAGRRGAQERHRSLRDVIDWSYDLLEEDERAMFRRAGVFRGAFDLNAAAALWPDGNRGLVADLIGRLTDKSLLTHRPGPGGSRWRMLQTIRAYALDRLAASGEEAAVRSVYLRWAAARADDIERRMEAGEDWRLAFDAVADDLRAAAAPAIDTDTGVAGLRHGLARALGHLTYAHRFMDESREHYEAAAKLTNDPRQATADLRCAADVALTQERGDDAFELLLAAADQAGRAGDDAELASAMGYAVTIADRFAANFKYEVPHDRLRGLFDSVTEICATEDANAQAYLTAADAWTTERAKTVPHPGLADKAMAAALRTGDPVMISGALDAVINVHDARGRLQDAHKLSKKRFQLVNRLPRHDPRAGIEIADSFYMAAMIAVTVGDLPYALEVVDLAEKDDIAASKEYVAASKPILPLVLQGEFTDAISHAGQMWDGWVRAQRPPGRWMASTALVTAMAHGLRGDDAAEQEWLARADELMRSGTSQVSGINLAAAFVSARVALHRGRLEDAVAAVEELPPAEPSWYEAPPQWYQLRAYAWAIAAEVAVAAGRDDAAQRLAAAAPAGQENYWAAACLARAAGRLHGDRAALEESLAGWERIEARFERACTLMLLPDRAAEGRTELTELRCLPREGLVT